MYNEDINISIEKDIYTKIQELKLELQSNESQIGDWKIIKIYESRLQGLPDPYSLEELVNEREKVRQEINILRGSLQDKNLEETFLNYE